MTPTSHIRVTYHIHPYAMQLPGGGEIQLLKYVSHLKETKCDVTLHDIWNPRLADAHILHHFHLIPGSIPFLDFVKKLNVKIAISPNLWINETNSSHIHLKEIQHYYRLADSIICNSHAEISNLAATTGLPTEKACVVYNGVDSDFSVPVSETLFRDWTNIKGPYLLNVANIEPRKNQLSAIKAARKIGVPLVSIGHIRDQAYFDRCAEEGQNGFFLYMGALNQMDPRLRSAYQHCAAFLFPSFLETPGIAALEAAAAGCQLVVTREGSAYEYFGDHAFYVNPWSEDSITDAVNRALSQKKNTILSEKIMRTFSWPAIAKQLTDAYSRLQSKSI